MSLTDYLKKAATAAVISSSIFLANNLYAAEKPVKAEKKQNKELENKISKLEKYIKKSDTDADARYELANLYQKKSEENKDKSLEKKAKDIFLKGIDIDMKKKSPYDILKRCNNIKFINFDKEGRWKKEYLKEVFQEDKKEKKPVLVFFYDNIYNGTKGDKATLREAVLVNRLYKKYSENIKIIAVNIPIKGEGEKAYESMCRNADKKGAGPMGIFEDPEVRKEKRLPRIRGPPSIAMYSTYDIVQGETPKKNDGNIKLIDILFGGPAEDEGVQNDLNVFNNWIEQCIFSKIFKKGHAYLFRNTYKVKPYKIE